MYASSKITKQATQPTTIQLKDLLRRRADTMYRSSCGWCSCGVTPDYRNVVLNCTSGNTCIRSRQPSQKRHTKIPNHGFALAWAELKTGRLQPLRLLRRWRGALHQLRVELERRDRVMEMIVRNTKQGALDSATISFMAWYQGLHWGYHTWIIRTMSSWQLPFNGKWWRHYIAISDYRWNSVEQPVESPHGGYRSSLKLHKHQVIFVSHVPGVRLAKSL